jgi:hypothetical protein
LLEQIVFQNPLFNLVIWTIVYFSDFILTLNTVRLYRKAAINHILFEDSLELNPYYQKDVDQIRIFSPRFLIAWLASSAVIYLAWLYSWWNDGQFWGLPFLMGALLLVEAVIHVRHFRNMFLFRAALTRGGLDGVIRYARWVSLLQSSVEFLGFALVFVFLYIMEGNRFLLGGATGCLAIGISHAWQGFSAYRSHKVIEAIK